ncbi:reverse transcriptase domain-containing protein [Tanacetum coccineum]
MSNAPKPIFCCDPFWGCYNITDYVDCEQEDGEPPNLPTFSATNELASICEQVEENLDVNIARELKEVQVGDIEMDEDDDIDYSNTKETLKLSHAKDPILVCMEFNDQSSFILHTIPSSISNKLVQVNAHGVVLGLYVATRKHFKSGLVGYHDVDDDVLELWMLFMEADLKHGLEHVVSSSSRANPGESFEVEEWLKSGIVKAEVEEWLKSGIVKRCEGLMNKVLVEELNERSLDVAKVNVLVEEERRAWMTPIREFIEKETLPDERVEAKTIREKANYVIREIHMGSCGMYDGPRRVVHKAMNAGYYWPSMHRDTNNQIKSCDTCQAYAGVPRLPKYDMISVTSAWPFRKWGIDIVGPLPEAPRKLKYLILAVDYFTKWLEAKPVASITGRHVKNFAFDNIVCRFGAIKTRLHQEGACWVEELPNVLWAHRTMLKTSNGETPFSLAYGTEAVIPAEIGMPTRRTTQRTNKENDAELRLNLDLLEERREISIIREVR